MSNEFTAGVVIQGDASGAVQATRLFKGALDDLNKSALDTARQTANVRAAIGDLQEGFLRFLETSAEFTGIAVSLDAIFENTIEGANATAKLNAVYQATGGVVGLTKQKLMSYADELNATSDYTSTTIQNTEALLLTFNKIQGVNFERTLDDSTDLAAVLGTDLASASRQLGIALQSPTEGLSALSREGIRFDGVTQDSIKALDAFGLTGAAQAIILSEIEERTHGAAAALADTLGGSLTALKKNFDDLFDASGTGQIDSTTESIKRLADELTDPAVQQGIRTLAAGIIDAFGEVTKLIGQTVNGFEDLVHQLAAFGDTASTDKIAAIDRQIAVAEAQLAAFKLVGGPELEFLSGGTWDVAQQAYIDGLNKERATLEGLIDPAKKLTDATDQNTQRTRESAQAALDAAAANTKLGASAQAVITGLVFGLQRGADPTAILKGLGALVSAEQAAEDQAKKDADAYQKLHDSLVELSGGFDGGVAALNKYEQQNLTAAKAVLDHALSATQLAGIQHSLVLGAGQIYDANLKVLTQQAAYDSSLQSSAGVVDRVAVAQAAYKRSIDEINGSSLSGAAADLARRQAVAGLNNALTAYANEGLKAAAQALDKLNVSNDLFGDELKVLEQRFAGGTLSADGYLDTLHKLVFGADDGNKALADLDAGLKRIDQSLTAKIVDPNTGVQIYSDQQAAADRQRLYAIYDLAQSQTADTTSAIANDYTTAFDQLDSAIRGVTDSWGKAVEGFAAGYKTLLDYNDKEQKALQQIAGDQQKYQDLIDAGREADASATLDKIIAEKNAYDDLNRHRLAIEDQANAQIAASVADLFGKQSSAYKVLNAASQAYHAAELARTVAELLPKGISAILTQGGGDPYSAFARMAAMTALVASLGIHVGASGGSTPPPNATQTDYGNGKGTVLGDISAQSQSIADSLTHLQDYAQAGNEYAKQELAQLAAINAGINGLGSLLYQTNISAGGATPFNLSGSYGNNVNGSALLAFGGSAGPLSLLMGNLNDELTALTSKIPIIGGVIGGVLGGLGNLGDKISGALFGSKTVTQSATGIEFGDAATVGQALTGGDIAQYYATLHTHKSGGLFGSSYSHDDDVTQALDAQTADQIDKIIGGLGGTILSAVQGLGGNVQQAQDELNQLPLDIGKVDLQGLTGDALQKQIGAVFSALGDRLAAGVEDTLGGLDLQKFQQAGEGLLGALTRVSSDFEYAEQVTAQLHLPLAQLTDAYASQADVASALIKSSVDIAETFGGVESGLGQLTDQFTGTATDLAAFVAQLYDARRAMNDIDTAGQALNDTIINAAGGLDTLQSGLQSYFGAFLTPEQQTAAEARDLTATLASLGLVLPGTRDGFVSLIDSLDLTTQAGQTAYGTLIGISGQFDTYYKGMEQQASDALAAMQGLTSSMQSFGQATASVAAQIKGAADVFNDAAALDALKSAAGLDDRITAGNQLDQLIQSTYSAQVQGIQSAAQAQIDAINDTLNAQIQALQSQADAQTQINQQIAQVQNAGAQAALQAYQEMQQAAQNLLTFANQLDTSSLAPGTPFDQLAANKSLFEQLVQQAQGGDAGAASQLADQGQSLLQLAQSIFGSTDQYQAIFSEVRDTSLSLGKSLAALPAPQAQELAALQAIEESMTHNNDILNRQIANAQTAAQAQIDAINNQTNVALADLQTKSLDALSQVENAVLSGNVDLQALLDAISLGNSAQEALLKSQLDSLQQLDASLAASATSGAALPHFAAGGIATTPSIFGEAGPEAAVPLKSGAIPVQISGTANKEMLAELQAIRQQLAAAQQPIQITVQTPDGRTLSKQTLNDLRERSRRGELVIYANGISKRAG